ncbi:MAG: YdcF family protein [Candidatus Omnitrophica bacterium]|nr:YdcF family protein [Candidatus Omnitrophota bacterium]
MNGAPHGRVRLWVVAALLGGVLGGAWAFPRAGTFLVVEDRFSHADIALVLSGDAVHRSLAARDLYRQGRVDRILVIPEPPDPAHDELVRLGLLDPAFVWSERILMASGVPRSKITFLPEPVDGTIQEAMRVRAFLKDKPPASLVLITSKFASRRARFIFRHVLQRQAGQVFCSPSPYDSFNPARWWAHPRQALYVVMEYQKLLVNALTLALGRLTP